MEEVFDRSMRSMLFYDMRFTKAYKEQNTSVSLTMYAFEAIPVPVTCNSTRQDGKLRC